MLANPSQIHEAGRILNAIPYHLYTIWLFTFSDMKTIMFPTAIWGLFNALSGPYITTNNEPSATAILCRFPLTLLWTWIVLLPFCINNQRTPDAIVEDKINKAWRPMPRERLTPAQAKRLMYAIWAGGCLLCYSMNAVVPWAMLFILGHAYNDLGGSEDLFIRNLINSLGFQTFGLGASMVAADSRHYQLNWNAALWFSMIGAVVFSTVQTQDMYDQEGDRERGRRTLPLVIGDGPARWATALAASTWSFLCPLFWGLPWGAYIVPVLVGLCVSFRTLHLRSVEADKLTFRIWCFWTLCLYVLPYARYLVDDGESLGGLVSKLG
jgi:4-hydroxybenzoate polyprenyltransferase